MEGTPRWFGLSRGLSAVPGLRRPRTGEGAGAPALPSGAAAEEASAQPADGLGEAFRRQWGNLLTALAAVLALGCLGRL